MRIPLVLAVIVAIAALAPSQGGKESFREQQLQYGRVRMSAKEKDEVLRRKFNDKSLAYPSHMVLFRAFKKEGLLEMWLRMSAANLMSLFGLTKFVRPPAHSGRSADSVTSKFPRASICWTGSIPKVISS
jgi:hypothetical protein